MGRNKIVIGSVIFAIIALGSLLFYQYRAGTSKQVKVYQISVIIAEESFDNKESLRLGLNQAGRDFGADITQVSLFSSNNAADQADKIRREAADNADAILLTALNSPLIHAALDEIDETIPVIIIGSEVDDYDGGTAISCDNYALGTDMGQKLIETSRDNKKIALVQYGFVQNEIKEKYRGVYKRLTDAGLEVVEWHLDEIEPDEWMEYFSRQIKSDEADIVVAFDAGVLETLAKVKVSLSQEYELYPVVLYGFGYSNSVVQHMDSGIIDCIGLAEEYSYGYLGVKAAIYHLTGKQYVEADLQYHIIDKDSMFEADNQRWLFPIG